MAKKRRLLDEYRFPGFHPRAEVQGIFGDPKARIIRFYRSQKKRFAAVVEPCIGAITTRRFERYGIYHAGMRGYIWAWNCGGWIVAGAGK
jgi:hypothetical protein